MIHEDFIVMVEDLSDSIDDQDALACDESVALQATQSTAEVAEPL